LKTTSNLRTMRWGALLLLAVLPGLPAHARTHHSESHHHNEAWARDRFAAAERMHEALNGRPPADRTRHDYQRVLDAYRSVYFGAPASTKADPSAVAVAETLVEMGRRFEDDKILNEAIAQYKFLRKEYPGSKNRCDALFTIGEIYNDDLNDPVRARATFQEFLHRYPHNRLVDDAQQAIADLDRQAAAEKMAEAEKKSGKETDDKNKTARDFPSKDKDADAQTADDSVKRASELHPAHLPRVTGIRHWSTPDYTRVAIDLESEIKFGSQRIDSPDRIFFDLRDTKLASTLVGKSFDVDDGFLKKIRVAQFQPGRTRVVLEVDNLSDYDAFLLPNPYRLIIDIHGKDGKTARSKPSKDTATKDTATKDAATNDAATRDDATADVEAAPRAGQNTGRKSAASSSTDANDLRVEAGKAPVTSEDVTDDTKIFAKNEPENAKARAAALNAASGETKAGVKKVIVEADDDDDTPPARPAKVDRRAGHRHSPSLDSAAASSPAAANSSARPSLPKPDEVTADETASDSSDSASNGSSEVIHKGVREAKPTAGGDRSLIRALGLKIGKIVIDPGHGGHDTGTIGPNGLEEKDLVLEVGRRLGKLLETRMGAEVVYTRKDDTFIPLETRTAIANQQRADLFISIHANSSGDPDARGVETYYLNFTSSPEALDVAARENAVSEKSIYELQDLVKKIALKEKIEESREFAGDVQESLHSGLAAKSPAIRNRGVKKAPFIVLIGANMPSILAEISFVSNPTDEHRLETSEYRQRIAESLYRGITKYVNGLSGVKLASKMDKTSGQ
jgi:N-acetylmuramoyl-L-alanine amidase